MLFTKSILLYRAAQVNVNDEFTYVFLREPGPHNTGAYVFEKREMTKRLSGLTISICMLRYVSEVVQVLYAFLTYDVLPYTLFTQA